MDGERRGGPVAVNPDEYFRLRLVLSGAPLTRARPPLLASEGVQFGRCSFKERWFGASEHNR